MPGGRATAGVQWRRAPLPPGDVVERHGMRVTTPARTLMRPRRRRLGRASSHGSSRRRSCLRLVTPGELLAAVERSRGRHGVGRLRAILLNAEEPSFTRSEAERRLLELSATAGLPRPRTNVDVAGYEVDFLWPQQRLVVEVDGYAFHRSRAAFERDRARDAALLAAGYRVAARHVAAAHAGAAAARRTLASALAGVKRGHARQAESARGRLRA